MSVPLHVYGAGTDGNAKQIGVDGRAPVLRVEGSRLRAAVSHGNPCAAPVLYPIMSEETYDAARARALEAMLRALAIRIQQLDGRGELLEGASELMKLIGDVRSELFHYEVRVTYDTPEIAESRRIVNEAKKDDDPTWQIKDWTKDEDETPEW